MPQKKFVYFDYRLDDKRILMLNRITGEIDKLHNEVQLLADSLANFFKRVSGSVRRNISIDKQSRVEGQKYANVTLKSAQFDLQIQKSVRTDLEEVKEGLNQTLMLVNSILNQSAVEVQIDKKIEQEIMELGKGNITVERNP